MELPEYSGFNTRRIKIQHVNADTEIPTTLIKYADFQMHLHSQHSLCRGSVIVKCEFYVHGIL